MSWLVEKVNYCFVTHVPVTHILAVAVRAMADFSKQSRTVYHHDPALPTKALAALAAMLPVLNICCAYCE